MKSCCSEPQLFLLYNYDSVLKFSMLYLTHLPFYTVNTVTITQSLASTSHQPQPTTVTITGTGDCEQTSCSDSAVIAVSAVCLLLVTTLTTVILIQCLLMARMRKSLLLLKMDMLCTSNEMYAEVQPPTSTDVPVTPNEAYGLHKRTAQEDHFPGRGSI